MVRRQVLVCNVCGRYDARSVTLIVDGQTAWRIDLCDEHMAPINELLPHAHESRMPARRPGSYETVGSLEQLLAIVGESGE